MLHDNKIEKYMVDCKNRKIDMYTITEDGTNELLRFENVWGYHFYHDAFGNIILDIETVMPNIIINDLHDELKEGFRLSGAFGPGADNLEQLPALLEEQGYKGFLISSSLGLEGWVIARSATIFNE